MEIIFKLSLLLMIFKIILIRIKIYDLQIDIFWKGFEFIDFRNLLKILEFIKF